MIYLLLFNLLFIYYFYSVINSMIHFWSLLLSLIVLIVVPTVLEVHVFLERARLPPLNGVFSLYVPSLFCETSHD